MLLQCAKRFPYRAAGGQDVINNEHTASGLEGRPATEFPTGTSTGDALGIRGRDAKLASYFKCQDHPAGCRARHHIDPIVPKAIGETTANLFSVSRLAQEVEL